MMYTAVFPSCHRPRDFKAMSCCFINSTWKTFQLIAFLPTFKNFSSFQPPVPENDAQLQLFNFNPETQSPHSAVSGSVALRGGSCRNHPSLGGMAGEAEPQRGRLGHNSKASLQPWDSWLPRRVFKNIFACPIGGTPNNINVNQNTLCVSWPPISLCHGSNAENLIARRCCPQDRQFISNKKFFAVG